MKTTIKAMTLVLAACTAVLAQAPGNPNARFMPPPPSNLPVTLGLQTRVTDTGVIVLGHNQVSIGKTIGIERGDTIVTVDGQQVGQVGSTIFDVDLTLRNALNRSPNAVILLRNGRDGRLVNVAVRRDQFVVITPPPVPPQQIIQVKKWYLQFLGREATQQEVISREAELRQGRVIETIMSELLAGREYYQRNGNDEVKFIGALFRDVLKRQPVHPEGANWLSRLKELRGDRTRFVDQFRTHYKV